MYLFKCLFFGFWCFNNILGCVYKLNIVCIYFDVYLNEIFFYCCIKVILLYIFVMDMIE